MQDSCVGLKESQKRQSYEYRVSYQHIEVRRSGDLAAETLRENCEVFVVIVLRFFEKHAAAEPKQQDLLKHCFS